MKDQGADANYSLGGVLAQRFSTALSAHDGWRKTIFQQPIYLELRHPPPKNSPFTSGDKNTLRSLYTKNVLKHLIFLVERLHDSILKS